jgi:hypothetical protein
LELFKCVLDFRFLFLKNHSFLTILSCIIIIGATCRSIISVPDTRLTQFNGKVYFFSWLDHFEGGRQFNWNGARKLCKSFCLDLATVETREEQEFVNRFMFKGAQYDDAFRVVGIIFFAQYWTCSE